MTECEFLAYNDLFRKRQAAIRAERQQTGPVRVGNIIPDVLADIEQRRQRRSQLESVGGQH